jgi:hypothetical protein
MMGDKVSAVTEVLLIVTALLASSCKPSSGGGAPATGGQGTGGTMAQTSGRGGSASSGSGGASGGNPTSGGSGGSPTSGGAGGTPPVDPPTVVEPSTPPVGAEPGAIAEPGAEAGTDPPPPDGTITIAASGDIAAAGGDQMRTAAILKRLLAEKQLAHILMLGDGAYRFSNLMQYRALYDPSWGVPELKAITRPIPGNHEYLENGNANGYFDYWNGAGQADGPAGPRGLGYYAFDIGTWRVIALNTNEDCRHLPCGEGSAQLTWLRAELARTTSRKCTLVMVHNPRYQNGTHRGDTPALAPAWNAMYDAGVDLVLAAHEHNYQQFAPMDKAGNVDRARGIRSFVLGVGGAKDYRDVFDTAQMAAEEKRFVNISGVLELTLAPAGYEWKFHLVDGAAGSRIGVMGSEVCH